MCRLYSSPEKVALGVQLTTRPYATAHRIMLPSKTVSISSTSRSTKTRSPTAGRLSPADQSFNLPKQAQLCCVSVQAQYQAFVRFYGRERHSKRLRSNDHAFWNLLSVG